MKQHLTAFTILFLSVGNFHSSFGQNINQVNIMNKADSMRMAGDLKGAIQAYQTIVAKDPLGRFNCYNYACALATDRQLDSCFKYAYKAIELETSIIPLTDKDFYFARQDKRWNAFEDKLVQDCQKKYNDEIKNWSYARQLFKLKVYDQSYTDELQIAGKQLGMNSSVAHAIMDLKDKINDHNQHILDSLIKQNGYPRISDVGIDAANAAFLIVQHSDSETQKKYIEQIKTLCSQGEAEWQSYALMYDRILVSEKKPQKYGTQFKINETTGKVELFPMINESKVDEWRKEMGLQPLASYLDFLRWQNEPKKKNVLLKAK